MADKKPETLDEYIADLIAFRDSEHQCGEWLGGAGYFIKENVTTNDGVKLPRVVYFF
jgi:hypothetical protein